MGRVVIVPGLAVRTYAEAPAQALRDAGHEVELLPAPAWRGEPTDLVGYGRKLAARVELAARPVDVLIGLSAGCQAAAVAASRLDIGHLLLVSPTLAPEHRTPLRLMGAWFGGGEGQGGPALLTQIQDWTRAGAPRIYAGIQSALAVRLEDVLPRVSAPLTIVHAEFDTLSPYGYAADLANAHGARLVVMPGAPHSWPINDHERFVPFVEGLRPTSGSAR